METKICLVAPDIQERFHFTGTEVYAHAGTDALLQSFRLEQKHSIAGSSFSR